MTDTSSSPSPRIDAAGRDLDTGGVFVVQRALIGNGWACAPKHLTAEQVQHQLDITGQVYIPGTPWTVAPRQHDDPKFQSPGHCEECPDTRQHWLLLGGMTSVVLMALADDAEGFSENLEIR